VPYSIFFKPWSSRNYFHGILLLKVATLIFIKPNEEGYIQVEIANFLEVSKSLISKIIKSVNSSFGCSFILFY
jgi:DNA-binding MarR family transcriptional regulator